MINRCCNSNKISDLHFVSFYLLPSANLTICMLPENNQNYKLSNLLELSENNELQLGRIYYTVLGLFF